MKHDSSQTVREQRPESNVKSFWLSFCDTDRPKGTQFLGACVVDVTEDEAEQAASALAALFPHAAPDAKWLAAAIQKSHRLGCNPGGEVASLELPSDSPMLAHCQRDVLMDRETIQRIDVEIALAEGGPR